MIRGLASIVLALLLPMGKVVARSVADTGDAPVYMASGELTLPENYRQWIFLTSGLDISYTTGEAAAAGHSVFQNVFVNPSAYKVFLASGTWPDKTMMVLEIRGAEPKAGIDRRGQTQGVGVHAMEVHVKDQARGGWSFFDFEGKTAKPIEHTASCYSCHEQHGAVDTTFVQYYPTLIELATAKGTLSAAYRKELSAAPKSPTSR